MPFLSLALEARPQGQALADAAGTVSYTELRCQAEEVGRRLVTAGLRPGDLVAVKGTLDRDFVATLHGVWMAGGIVAPMSTRWTPFEEQQALHLLRPRMSYPPPLRATRGHETRRPENFHFKLELPPLSASAPSPSALPGLRGGDTAAVLLTSGTSGSPRAVGLTAGNLMASARASRERLGLAPSDRWLGSLSPAHVGGLALLTRAAALGSGVVLRGAFRAETFLALAEEGAITHASLVPTMLHQVLAALGKGRAPPSLRCVLLGGAPAPEALLAEALAAGFPMALTYGLTEASSQVATAEPDLVLRKPGTVGAPLPGVEVSVAEEGELLVRGPTVAPGLADGDGWLRTGDLARMDGDGHLWIVGRASDRIISGGVKVDPAEVEAVLSGHPGVLEAAVVGLPDPEWGERVVAAVVSVHGRGPSEAELGEKVRAALSAAKWPRAWRFVEALPRNATGKVDREGVRALFR